MLNTKITNRYHYDFSITNRVDLVSYTTDSGKVYTIPCYGLLAVMCDGAGSPRGGHAQCRLTDLDGNMIMPCVCTHPTSTSSNLCTLHLMPGYKISNVAVLSGTVYFYPIK